MERETFGKSDVIMQPLRDEPMGDGEEFNFGTAVQLAREV